MALAYLKYSGTEGYEHLFEIDIGKNKYYSYTVGDEETISREGIKTIVDKSYESEIFGPLPEANMGRDFIKIPDKLFDIRNRYIQLYSYRQKNKVGPAVSEIAKVISTSKEEIKLPEISFTRSKAMETKSFDYVPIQYREEKFSDAMFLNVLTSLIPKILPSITSLLGGIAGKTGTPAVTGVSPGGSSTLIKTISQPETIKLLQQLLTQVSNGKSSQKSLSMNYEYEKYPALSEAQVAPALLAALPALMPLLGKVLNPQTLNAIFQNLSPDKLIGTVTSGIKDLAKLGLQSHEQDLKHLRELNPGVDDSALDQLLAGLSIDLSKDNTPEYRRIDSVKLEFVDQTEKLIAGRSRLCYFMNTDLAFPLSIETPKTIEKAVLTISVKDPKTLDILATKKYPMKNIINGRLTNPVRLPAMQLALLKANEDYLVSAHLIWRNKSGRRIGVNRSQLITVLDKFTYDRTEESNEIIPLNDIDAYRRYWHKSWQGSLSSSIKRVNFDCKYYIVLEDDRESNAIMETHTKYEANGHNGYKEKKGKLKSGMIYSLSLLNHLIPQISNYPSLDGDQMDAIKSSDFKDSFSKAARTQIQFRGRAGENCALWHYPEVKMQKVILLQAGNVSDNGHIRDFTEYVVHFPVPVIIHFIGAKSQR